MCKNIIYLFCSVMLLINCTKDDDKKIPNDSGNTLSESDINLQGKNLTKKIL